MMLNGRRRRKGKSDTHSALRNLRKYGVLIPQMGDSPYFLCPYKGGIKEPKIGKLDSG
jgi:hypothetical protein